MPASNTKQTEVKICGLKTADAVDAAVQAGADMVGFVFFERSPRNLSVDDMVALSKRVPEGVLKVGLVVDAMDDALDAITKPGALDVLQLHGMETPARVTQIKQAYGLQCMKVLAVARAEDVAVARAHEKVADRLLFDAKPPKEADRPGGNAEVFDWNLLSDTEWSVPWLLAGGLTPENVAEAIKISGAPGVDVSSGVEDAPGEKNPDKIWAFIMAAKTA